ncbi:hypothetical protein HC891_27260 [Candidatus Gracilibacteria bacterium]|nr:hypothetical protein [Candidatus Gracilibacteria bacterium]
MDTNLIALVRAFADQRVLILGDAMLDSYLAGTASKLCREAPAPVIDLSERVDVPGGAANTAVNVSALGGVVELLSVIGDDNEGELLRAGLEDHGINVEHLLVCPGGERSPNIEGLARPSWCCATTRVRPRISILRPSRCCLPGWRRSSPAVTRGSSPTTAMACSPRTGSRRLACCSPATPVL